MSNDGSMCTCCGHAPPDHRDDCRIMFLLSDVLRRTEAKYRAMTSVPEAALRELLVPNDCRCDPYLGIGRVVNPMCPIHPECICTPSAKNAACVVCRKPMSNDLAVALNQWLAQCQEWDIIAREMIKTNVSVTAYMVSLEQRKRALARGVPLITFDEIDKVYSTRGKIDSLDAPRIHPSGGA